MIIIGEKYKFNDIELEKLKNFNIKYISPNVKSLEKALKNMLVSSYKPVLGVSVPSLVRLSAGRVSANIGTFATIFKHKQTGKIRVGLSPSAFFSAPFYSGETYNLSGFGGVILNPNYFPLFFQNKFAYHATGMAGLNFNKYLVNSRDYGVRTLFLVGVSSPLGEKELRPQPLGGFELRFRRKRLSFSIGGNLVGKTPVGKVVVGYTNKDGSPGIGVGVNIIPNEVESLTSVSTKGMTVLPTIEVGTQNLLWEAVKTSAEVLWEGLDVVGLQKPLKKLWDSTFGSLFGRREEEEPVYKEVVPTEQTEKNTQGVK